MRLGRGIDKDTTHRPLVNAAAVRKARSHAEDSLAKGMKLHTAGKPSPTKRSSSSTSSSPSSSFPSQRSSGATQETHVTTRTLDLMAAIFTFDSDEEVLNKTMRGSLYREGCKYGLAEYQDINAVTIRYLDS